METPEKITPHLPHLPSWKWGISLSYFLLAPFLLLTYSLLTSYSPSSYFLLVSSYFLLPSSYFLKNFSLRELRKKKNNLKKQQRLRNKKNNLKKQQQQQENGAFGAKLQKQQQQNGAFGAKLQKQQPKNSAFGGNSVAIFRSTARITSFSRRDKPRVEFLSLVSSSVSCRPGGLVTIGG